MTKKEIVKTISEKIGMTQLKTKEIVQETFDAIVEALVEQTKDRLSKGVTDDKETLGRVELRNFGVFEVKQRAGRKARNPRTGEAVEVPEKYVVTFKPGKEMEKRVRDLEGRSPAEKEGATEDTSAQPTPLPPNNQNIGPATTYDSPSEATG